MTTREVVLDGGSPWGFRLHGGADLNQPLRISRVNPGSKAALRGIREGDLITSINTRSTRDITNAEAHYLLRNSGDSLKLGLNEECSGSPKRRQYRTVHQETTSETVKRSSRTSHTLTSSKTVSVTAANGNTDNGDCIGHPNPPVAALSSTSSSSSTPSGMADSGRRRRRGRNQRRKARNLEEEVVYRVESPTQVKSPERKKPVKSRSLDDDDLVKIQEVTEVSESEDKGEYFVSEAESETMEEQEPELTLHLAQYTPEQEPLISPEEELTLRNFLEGLNLVNCPEDAFRQVMRETSTMESVKSRRARKRQALEQYFTPIAQNPRFLDVISEETSDLSDREQKSLTQHLKQGTPEPEVPVRRRTSTPILVGSRIISAPVTHQVCSSSEAEVVFLEDSSNSSSPDPKSEHEDEKDTNDDLFSSNNSSVPDLRETEVVEETKRVKFTVKKDDVLVSGSDSTTVLKNLEDAKQIISELTPPPTPDPDSGAETSREDLQPNEDKTEAIFTVFKDEETLHDEIEATSTPVESLEANLAPIIRNIEEDFESLSNEKVTVKDNINKVVDGSETLKSSTSEIIKDQKLHEEHRNSQNIVKKVLVRTVPIVIEEYRKEDIKTEVQNISTKLESKEKINVESSSGNITNGREEKGKHGESHVVTNIPINIETTTEAHRERIVPIKIEPDEEIGNKTEEKPISASIVREIPIKIEINEEEKDKPPITRNIPIKIEATSDKKESGSKSILSDLFPKVKEDKQPAFRNIPITIETKKEEKHEEVKIRNIPIKIESNKKETNEREERKITTSIIKDIPISIVCEEEEKDKTQLIKNISIQILSTENEEKKEEGKTEKGSEGIEPVVRNIPIKIEPKEEGAQVPVTGRAPTVIVTKSEDVTHNSTIDIKIQSKDKKNSNVPITNIPIKIEDATSNKEKTRKEEERVRNIPIKIESNKKETNEREERKITTSIIKDIPISIVCEEEEKDKTQLIKNISIQISAENEEKKEDEKTEKGSEGIEPVVRNIPIKIEPKEEGAQVPVTGRAPTVIVTKSEDVTHNSTIDIKVQSEDKKTQSTQSTVVRTVPIKIEAVVKNENKNRNVPIITNIPINIEDAIEGLDIKNISTKVNSNEEGHIIRNIPIRLESEEQKKEQKDKEVVASFVSSNILSPPPPNPSPSPSLSSGSSSRATSLCTAKYNSMSGSVGDITSIKDDDFGTKPHSPLTLRELCVHNLMSQPFGAVMLQELADVSSSIHHITNNLLSAANPKSSIQWVGLATDEEPRLLVCLSPTQRAQLDRSTRVDDEASKLLDLHEKFIFRTWHGDAVERRAKNDVEIASIGADAVSNRLLAIIRAAEETAPRKVSANMSSARLRARDLDEWLRHARKGERRASLPHDFYAQQMLYLQEKEREIQRELEKLEDEKQKLAAEMAPQRVFRPEDYHISRKGDFAETRKSRPASMPSEFFRQQMYEDYLGKIAAMEERKQHQVIKVTQLDESSETKPVSGIKDEFMDKVKEKQKLGKLLREEESSDESDKLPKHLQEFMDITHGNRTDGVWTPGQKESSRSLETQRSESDVKDEPLSPVWTPKSATSSPTLDRKEFRPIKYESPVLSRKQTNPDPNEPPWKIPETSSDTGIALSSALEKRLPTSHSAPGFSELSGRLPKAQNPTIILLQKAREGQLPKGASYIEDPNYRRVAPNEKPPLIGPGEILYKIKNEYTSESDGERPRKMADLGPRKFEGIGPTTRDGMPLILRSEVKDANQSKWYKKMYDTIHKQKPHRDEYVTVRYKQRRGQYPYTSGYLSEPEPGAYDSDFTESKYATLDRRRMPSNVSSTMPRSVPPERSSGAITHGHDVYRNQPGRIENYIPGHSSISEKEAREWWDEVMDIFDGWLDDNSALPTYMFSRAVAKSHLEQQKRVPQTKSFMNQALKESGYESDSTLVFRRRDDTAQQISPFEQKEAYKHIQKGGDIPLHGLRKPAPERPKEEPQLEYFPISPTLTRIRVHKNIKPQTEILCYPVTVHPHPSSVFAHYKRTAPSGVPPSPPRRKSSRNNSTLRLISTMKVKTEKSPVCKRHETCFSTTTTMDKTNVKYLRDKITCKLAPAKGKPKMKVSKVVTASPELKSRIVSTLTTTKDPKTATKTIQSRTNVVGSKCCTLTGSLRKPCKKCTTTKIFTPQTKTFGTEKRKVDLTLPKLRPNTIVSSPDLLSPTEVKKAVERSLPAGTVFKKSNALLASVRNGTATNLKEVVLPIKVGVSEKGKTILRTNLRNKSLSPIPSERSKHRSSLESLRSPQGTKRIISTVGKTAPKSVKAVKGKPVEIKKMKKAKKEEINGEIVKKGKELVPGKCAGRAAGSEIVKKLREMDDSEFGSTDTLTDLQKQKEAIQTDYFFQHLFLRDLPSPTPSTASRTSWLLERYQLSQRRSEPTISAMKVYLKHTKPVTDSKFRSLDMALSRSRSASPKSVTWELQHVEKRSSSLPPKLVFSQTSRPVSPKVERRFTRSPTPPPPRSPSSRKIMQLKSESPKPKHEMTIYSCPSISQSSSSIDSYDRKEYQSYVKELLRSSRRSPRFKDLNDFYSAIEKFGELEQKTSTANLKPRRRFEDEIIDYERWREVRTRERAERELKTLVDRLREDSKEKGFLFSPKEIDAYRWKKELDRGLRVKEKSVDNIKEEFERLKSEESERESARRRELACLKDTYKPLWRGDSVLGLANRMVERRAHSEGRVPGTRQKLIDSERMLTHGIGSRLWSSLSSEQVNILKNQLSEIYSQNLQKKKTDEFSVHVPEKKVFQSSLTVRRNSDSIQDKVLSEPEKKCLSQSISREVLDHVNKRVLPLVLAKEESEEQPCKALVKTDATSTKMPSSETESGSTDESNKTVIHREEIKKKVEYFETVADQEKYTPTVYKPCESLGDVSSTDTEPSLRRRSITSRSYQNLKEFFGEKELMRIATLPLSATRKPTYVSPERPNLRVRVPSPSISEATSIDSVFRSRSISPYPEDALTLVRNGEVRRLRSKFEGTKLKRSKSDSNLYRPMYGGDVELLRSKYEYPAHAGRGRSRLRRGGVVSPTFLRAEDRFMPHINIISKIASLYARKNSPHSRTSVESWQTGDVDKMRRKFDVGRISLLGHMFTSSPELRDITPYLAASWIAHRFPRSEDNTRSLSSPESSVASRDTSRVRRDRPKSASPPQPEPPLPPPKGHHGSRNQQQESPRKYVENEVTIHYKTPVRQEIKEYLSEDELAYRQAEAMKRIYQEERRRKYLQVSKSLQELQDMNSRRHTDNFIPSQKSPIPLNRYDDFDDLSPPVKPRPRSPEPRLLARALYNFVGQTARELTFRKGDLIYVRRQVDKNWYEGELNAMVGLFPVNYVEIVTYDTAKTTPRKSHEGQARAKYNFVAQTHLELSLAKGELVVVTRRVDDNWFEGKIGGRKGIFPVSYVDLLVDPGDPPVPSTKPVAAPASHSMLLNGSAGGKQSMGSHSYTPTLTANQLTTSYRAKPVQVTGGSYGSLHRTTKSPVSQALHIETQSEPVPYRAMYKYLPQNDDELELFEGDTVFVLEKCDDGWFVGSSERTGAFGTFPGNYVEKI